MHSLISKLFAKRGIKDSSELSQEEQETFHQWQVTLSKEELTLADVEKFCGTQIDRIETSFQDLDLPVKKLERLVVQHAVYKSLKNIISGPKVEREALEKYLTTLLD